MITYNKIKKFVYALNLEGLSHGIEFHELNNPKRFEAAGLKIIDVSKWWDRPNSYYTIRLFDTINKMWKDEYYTTNGVFYNVNTMQDRRFL